MKKVARFFLVTLLFLSLYGCLEVVYEIGVDKNDVEHLTMRMGMPAVLAPYMGEILTKVQDEGFTVKTDTQGDKVWIIGTKEYAKGTWDLPALPSTVTITSVARDTFQVDDYVVFKKYILDVEYQYQGNNANTSNPYSSSMYSIPVKFVVTLPGKILETDAPERQGGAAVWNFVLAQNGTIAMKLVTYKLRWGLISALLLSGAVFVGAIVFLVTRSSGPLFARRRVGSNPRTAPEKSEFIVQPVTRTGTGHAQPALATPRTGSSSDAVPAQPGPPLRGSTYYVVTLSLPPDRADAEKIIRTLAKGRNMTTAQIIAELEAGRLTIRFSDKGLLEKNLAILENAGFNPRVTTVKR